MAYGKTGNGEQDLAELLTAAIAFTALLLGLGMACAREEAAAGGSHAAVSELSDAQSPGMRSAAN